MKSYPLKSLTIDEAINLQFKLVDAITYEFNGYDILTMGDLGVHPKGNQPQTTRNVERVLARFFDAEDGCFVRGAGTAAIREGLSSFMHYGDTLLVHDAPIYTTTQTTLTQLGIKTHRVDFNDLQAVKACLEDEPNLQGVLIQYTRQQLEDSYDMETLVQTIQSIRSIPILTDDNYAVMKVRKIGTQCGAHLSCFSLFKLLGPEGIGFVVGKSTYIETIRQSHYSGGSQTQGFEAMEALKSLVYAPVSLAIQARETDLIVTKLNEGTLQGVMEAHVVNAQSKVILVKLTEPIAKAVLDVAHTLGAAAYPIGAESKYEVSPMFYRVSGTMRASHDEFETQWIRINPMRAGSDTVMRILGEAIEKVRSCS